MHRIRAGAPFCGAQTTSAQTLWLVIMSKTSPTVLCIIFFIRSPLARLRITFVILAVIDRAQN
ncbi:hypothetical protein P2W49_02395 [Yersinia intermedia]|nr:hypothetical protein P2W49_02395 [Yersinia intermedia]